MPTSNFRIVFLVYILTDIPFHTIVTTFLQLSSILLCSWSISRNKQDPEFVVLIMDEPDAASCRRSSDWKQWTARRILLRQRLPHSCLSQGTSWTRHSRQRLEWCRCCQAEGGTASHSTESSVTTERKSRVTNTHRTQFCIACLIVLLHRLEDPRSASACSGPEIASSHFWVQTELSCKRPSAGLFVICRNPHCIGIQPSLRTMPEIFLKVLK